MPIALAESEAIKAAAALGIDRKNFDYFVNIIDCGGSASAWAPGNTMGVYGQAGGPHVFNHEFGHNLGYNHGGTYTQCYTASNVVSAPGSCQTIGYGDTGDSVSGGGTLYPANNRWYSGWLDNSQAAVIGKSGLYRLAKLGNAGPQLYLINRTGLSPSQVALEYRKPTSFDNFLPTDNRVNGVWIRYTTMGRSLLNTQLDGTPLTATTADPTFLPGKTFQDVQAGITVTVCTASTDGATVAVAINNQPLPNCPTTPLPLPGISNPPFSGGGTQTNPVVLAGTGIPGARAGIDYKRSESPDWIRMYANVGADGKWQASPLTLSAGKYEVSVFQTLDSKVSLYNLRLFEVRP